tara:strand:- start:47 stop:445 length:399 start_codon:yes stop_codon:yes gene_type:complete
MEHTRKKYKLEELLATDFVADLKEEEYENAKEQLQIALEKCEKNLTARDFTTSTNYKNIQRDSKGDSKDDLMFQMEEDKENILKRDIETLKARLKELHQELKNCKEMEQSKEPQVIFDSDEMYGDNDRKLKF